MSNTSTLKITNCTSTHLVRQPTSVGNTASLLEYKYSSVSCVSSLIEAGTEDRLDLAKSRRVLFSSLQRANSRGRS